MNKQNKKIAQEKRRIEREKAEKKAKMFYSKLMLMEQNKCVS